MALLYSASLSWITRSGCDDPYFTHILAVYRRGFPAYAAHRALLLTRRPWRPPWFTDSPLRYWRRAYQIWRSPKLITARIYPSKAYRPQIQVGALKIQNAICLTASPDGPRIPDTTPGRGSAAQARRPRRNPPRRPFTHINRPIRRRRCVAGVRVLAAGSAIPPPVRAFWGIPTLVTART